MCVHVCGLECQKSVSLFSLKGHSCLEARYSALIAHRLKRRADALPTAFCKLHHLLPLYSSPPPPPLYLSPPAASRSLDLISPLRQMECCSPSRNPSACAAVGLRLYSFPAPRTVWAIRIQREQCRPTIRACLIERGLASGLLGRARELNNALTHQFSDIFHKCSH